MDAQQWTQNVISKSFAFKRAALHYASHRASCRRCSDSEDCETSGELWMVEFQAQSDLFDALALSDTVTAEQPHAVDLASASLRPNH